MNKDQGTTTQGDHHNLANGINRREMVRRLMLAGGAGFALPGVAEGRPIAGSPSGQQISTETRDKGADTSWVPEFFDPHQNETVTVLAERIIPGSGKAQVNRFIDLLLSVDTQDAREKFLASLSAFEAESLRRYSRPYKDLTNAQQDEIVAFASGARSGSLAEGRQLQATMRDHFENIKQWVAGAYFSSEVGMKEMGWTGQVFFTSFPGCQQSGE